ncbi:MAG: hypothetical protein ACK5X3_19610 [Pseudomonadota bacterium]
MTATNLPVLYQNIMFGLPDDLARDAFLWASQRTQDDPMLYKAEDFAREVAMLTTRLKPWLDFAFRRLGRDPDDPALTPDLMNFILKRHANWRFGGNVTLSYAYAGAP